MINQIVQVAANISLCLVLFWGICCALLRQRSAEYERQERENVR